MVRQGMWPGTVEQFKESVVEDFDRWADESALNEDLSKFILHEYWEQRWEEVVGQQSHWRQSQDFLSALTLTTLRQRSRNQSETCQRGMLLRCASCCRRATVNQKPTYAGKS